MRFVICPDFVELASSHGASLGNEVLLHISNKKTPFKIYCDSSGVLLEHYAEIAKKDKSGLIKTWLNFLAINRGVTNIEIRHNPEGEMKLDILKEVLFDRNLVVKDEKSYKKYIDDILSYNITLMDAERVTDAIYSNSQYTQPFDPDDFLNKLFDSLANMSSRKYSHKLEDLHNDILVSSLRQYGFNVSDQERGGTSPKNNGNPGELDAVIRSSSGRPVSIIEAFRLSSCGDDNTVISEHINKLLNFYDTIGHKRNFVIVYSEAKDFAKCWRKYKAYMLDINNKPDFLPLSPLISFNEFDDFEATEIRVGRATHKRSGKIVEVIHMFVNFSRQ